MTNLFRFRNVLFAAALVAAPAACKKNETAREADRAAERVKDHTKDLRDEARDVVETAQDRREALNKKAGREAGDTIDDMNDLRRDSEKRTAKDTSKTVDEAHEVADNARDNRDALRDKGAETAKDIADEEKDVAKEASDVKHAEFDFGYARLTRVGTLRAVHALALSQPQLINAFAHDVELNDKERGLINEKLQIFQMRLDEAGNQIEALATVPAETWEQRHDDVNKAMDKMEGARKDAWKVLHASQKAQARTSMR